MCAHALIDCYFGLTALKNSFTAYTPRRNAVANTVVGKLTVMGQILSKDCRC